MNKRFSIALFLTIIMTNIILYFFLPLSIVTKWDLMERLHQQWIKALL